MTQLEHVAQILYSGLGGHGGVAFGMVDGDVAGRWRSTFGFLGIEPLVPAYAERCRVSGIDYEYIPATQGKPWEAWRPLYRWLHQTQPSAILLHSPPALVPCWRYARQKKIPLIVVEHQPNHLKTKQDWFYSYLSMFLGNRVVFLTKEYEKEMRERLGRPFQAKKVVVIPNGVNTEQFSGATPFGTAGLIKIGMAARFTSTKLFPLLIAAALSIRSRRADLDFILTLAGSGEEWEQVRSSADSSLLGRFVRFEGMLSGPELASWYRDLDVYCHISAGETLSISVLQAMASGLPILGSDVPGINNLLEAAGTGLLSRNEAEAIAGGILKILDNPYEAQAMGRRARTVAEVAYSSRRMFTLYDDLVRAERTV